MNALTRKRPTPGGLIAKLHSFVASNSAACLSFITLRTSSIVCCGDSAVFDTGVILPSTLIAGGNAAVMKRSEPRCLTRSSSSSWMNLVARFRRRHLVAADHLEQALVERLHADVLARLDRGVHLRDLVLADQVADGR